MSVLHRDDATHKYFVDDKPVPISVTGVLARTVVDYSHLPSFVRERALKRGTTVHKALCAYNDPGPDGLPHDLDVGEFMTTFPQLAGYLQAWFSFCQQRAFTPMLNERLVYSRRYDVAGAVDSLGELDGVGALLDFCTGDAKTACKSLQTGAYHGIALEWASEDTALAAFFAAHPFVRRYALELKKDGTFKLQPYTAPSDFREFLALLESLRLIEKYRGKPVEIDDDRITPFSRVA